jgi:hypothetical protein
MGKQDVHIALEDKAVEELEEEVTVSWACWMIDFDISNCTLSRCVHYGTMTQIEGLECI